MARRRGEWQLQFDWRLARATLDAFEEGKLLPEPRPAPQGGFTVGPSILGRFVMVLNRAFATKQTQHFPLRPINPAEGRVILTALTIVAGKKTSVARRAYLRGQTLAKFLKLPIVDRIGLLDGGAGGQ